MMKKLIAFYWTLLLGLGFLGIVASLVYNAVCHWNGERPVSQNIRQVAESCPLLVFLTGILIGLLAADWLW